MLFSKGTLVETEEKNQRGKQEGAAGKRSRRESVQGFWSASSDSVSQHYLRGERDRGRVCMRERGEREKEAGKNKGSVQGLSLKGEELILHVCEE